MSARVTFEAARVEDAAELAREMRSEDAAELALMEGLAPLEVLEMSVRTSDAAFTARLDGRIACIFGARRISLMEESAAIWLVAGRLADERPLTFARHVLRGMSLVRRAVPAQVYTNYVWADNERHVRLVEWLGAWLAPWHKGVRGRLGGRYLRFGIAGEPEEGEVADV